MKLLLILTIAILLKSAEALNCTDDICYCPQGEAVNRNEWCDGKVDCTDDFDEADETCKFPCGDDDNTIVSRIENGYPAQVCDGIEDCPHGEDEANCEFTRLFNCGDGTQITEHQVCDSINDCPDGLDEAGCGLNCDAAFTSIPCGQCVPLLQMFLDNSTVATMLLALDASVAAQAICNSAEAQAQLNAMGYTIAKCTQDFEMALPKISAMQQATGLTVDQIIAESTTDDYYGGRPTSYESICVNNLNCTQDLTALEEACSNITDSHYVDDKCYVFGAKDCSLLPGGHWAYTKNNVTTDIVRGAAAYQNFVGLRKINDLWIWGDFTISNVQPATADHPGDCTVFSTPYNTFYNKMCEWSGAATVCQYDYAPIA